MELIEDAYLERIVRDTDEYTKGLLDSIFVLIGTDDEEIWGDGQVAHIEDRVSIGIIDYLVLFKGDYVGAIRSTIKSDETYSFEQVIR